MPNVRIPDPSEEDAIVSAVSMMHATGEWGMRHADGSPFLFSVSKTRETVRKALTRDNAWIAVIGDPGRIEGSIYLEVNSPFCSNEHFLSELWTFVLPEYRKSTHAVELLKFAKAFAKAIDLPLILGVLSHQQTDAKNRLFSSALGRAPSGAIFLYHHENDGAAS